MSFILLSIIPVNAMYSLFINFILLIIYNGKKVDNEVQKEHQLQKTQGVFTKAILQIWQKQNGKKQETSQIIGQMAGRLV